MPLTIPPVPQRDGRPDRGGGQDLMIMSQRILGANEAQAFFRAHAARQGSAETTPVPTPEFVQALERELAASVGAATANAMISQIIGGQAISVEDLMAVADESAQLLEYSGRLEVKSRQLAETAQELGRANEKAHAALVAKGQFSQPDQPRAAYADDVDPRVLRDFARYGGA